MTLGASWSGQFVYALISIAFGVTVGVVSLAYSVKWKRLGKIEVGIVDFVATLIIAVIYLLAVDVGGKGQPTAYSIGLYLLSALLTHKSVKKLASFCAGRAHGKLLKK